MKEKNKKTKKEEIVIDDELLQEEETVFAEPSEPIVNNRPVQREVYNTVREENRLVNCLQNKKITVKHIPKESGMITDPRHILYGGMADNAVIFYTVPQLSSGKFVNVLTNEEKEYLEYIMGLEFNALSVYRKDDNFWENLQVRLTKTDNILDLSSPEDYIKYKVLLANKDLIAPSMEELQDRPKATYKFVIIEEGEVTSKARKEMTSMMRAYTEFGKIENDASVLRTVIELVDGRPVADNTKLEFLQTQVNKIIQSNTTTFLRVLEDKYFDNKVLIKEAINAGIIANKGNYLYHLKTNQPLCNNGEEPTLSIAARFLGEPKNQTLKFSIQENLK